MDLPEDLSNLLQAMATDFPAILRGNLLGIYLWGSLTYNAFDETCSDVDCIGVTRRDLDDRQFSEPDEWFKNKKGKTDGSIGSIFVSSSIVNFSTGARDAAASTTTREGSSGTDRTETRSSG
jgi:hypothetical protein